MRDVYVVRGIVRACEIVRAFRNESDLPGLSDLVRRTGLKKATVFRAVQSLVAGGLLEHAGGGRYRSTFRSVERRRFRFGYATQASDSAFARDVTEGIRRATEEKGIDLVEVDNRYSPKVAVRGVDALLREHVDVVIEFQTYQAVAPLVAAKVAQAGVPLIAIDIPHPGAIYYGANNYFAGRIGGRAAARWVLEHWGASVDEVLLLTLSAAGPLPNSRLTGFAVGCREIIRDLDDHRIVPLDSNGGFSASLDIVRKHLRISRSQRIVVGAINDAVALGALRAFEEAGRLEHCAVMSQNASIIARAELRRPGSRLIGSVAYFPERYGERIVTLALDVLSKRPVPSAVFARHCLITPSNVDHYYPNDRLSSDTGSDALLLRYTH